MNRVYELHGEQERIRTGQDEKKEKIMKRKKEKERRKGNDSRVKR